MQMLIKAPVTRMLHHCQYSHMSTYPNKQMGCILVFSAKDFMLYSLAPVAKIQMFCPGVAAVKKKQLPKQLQASTCFWHTHKASYLHANTATLSVCLQELSLLCLRFPAASCFFWVYGSNLFVHFSSSCISDSIWLCDVLYQLTPSMRNWQLCDCFYTTVLKIG